MGTWRPANLKDLPKTAAHVINQLTRETNMRIDDLEKRVPPHEHLKGSSKINFGTIPANSAVERTVTLIGANTTGAVSASPQITLGNPNLVWSAQSTGKDRILIRVANPTGAPVAANTVKWNIFCIL